MVVITREITISLREKKKKNRYTVQCKPGKIISGRISFRFSNYGGRGRQLNRFFNFAVFFFSFLVSVDFETDRTISFFRFPPPITPLPRQYRTILDLSYDATVTYVTLFFFSSSSPFSLSRYNTFILFFFFTACPNVYSY